jgi:iron uptake system component EfeO
MIFPFGRDPQDFLPLLSGSAIIAIERASLGNRSRWLLLAPFLAVVTAPPPAAAAPLDEAVVQFQPLLVNWIDESLGQARILRARIAAQDLPGAQHAWLAARRGWESAEVITDEAFPDLDSAIDAWPDAQAGFHAIEARLFGAHQVDVLPLADELVKNLSDFEERLRNAKLTPQNLLNGTTKLAFEVGENKADGGESQFSGNSIVEIGYNIAGIKAAYETVFAASLDTGTPKLAKATADAIAELEQTIHVADVKNLDQDQLRRRSEELTLALRTAAPAIGLGSPNLEN